MSAEEPEVSVLMTAYNREKYIAEAIESVLASTFSNYELIVVDDGSTDGTVAIVQDFLRKDDRIQLHINPKNLGDYPNRNKAVSLAKGKYIMFCDSDDSFFPDSIGYCLGAMNSFPSAGMGIYYAGDAKAPFLLDRQSTVQMHFFKQPVLTIGPGGTIMQRKVFIEAGGYPERYGPANDMYFNLKMSCATPMLFLPKLFLHYRIHDGQEQNNLYSYIHNNYRYMDDALAQLEMGLSKKEKNYLMRKNQRRFAVNQFRYLLKTKDLSATRKLWEKAGFKARDFITGIFHF